MPSLTLTRVLPVLSTGMGLLALGGGIYGLAKPRDWAWAAFAIRIDDDDNDTGSSLSNPRPSSASQESAALTFTRVAAARNVGLAAGILTLACTGQMEALAHLFTVGAPVAYLDAWICRQHGSRDSVAKADGHFFMGLVSSALAVAMSATYLWKV